MAIKLKPYGKMTTYNLPLAGEDMQAGSLAMVINGKVVNWNDKPGSTRVIGVVFRDFVKDNVAFVTSSVTDGTIKDILVNE